MADALTVALVGTAGTLAVAAVTVTGTIIAARTQAATSRQLSTREDAARADERMAEERRRELEQQAELKRLEQQRLADAAQEQVTRRRETSEAFIAQAQLIYRVLRFQSDNFRAADDTLWEQGHWNELSRRLGVVMSTFDEPTARSASSVVDALQDVLVLIATQSVAPDSVQRALQHAADLLESFVAQIR